MIYFYVIVVTNIIQLCLPIKDVPGSPTMYNNIVIPTGGHLEGGGDTNICTAAFPLTFVELMCDYVQQFNPKSLNILWIGCGDMYEVKKILQILTGTNKYNRLFEIGFKFYCLDHLTFAPPLADNFLMYCENKGLLQLDYGCSMENYRVPVDVAIAYTTALVNPLFILDITYKLKHNVSLNCDTVLICFTEGIKFLNDLLIPNEYHSPKTVYLENLWRKLGISGKVHLTQSYESRIFRSIAIDTISSEKLASAIGAIHASHAYSYLHMTVCFPEGELATTFRNDLVYLKMKYGNSQAGSHSKEYILQCIKFVSFFFNYESQFTKILSMICSGL